MTDGPDPAWLLQRRQEIGDRIRHHRLHRNLTQEALSFEAGVSRFTIQRVEAGRASYSVDQLLLIARALEVSAVELVADDGPGT